MEELKRYALSEVSGLFVLGRTSEVREPLALFWSGAGFEVNYSGHELWCELETDYTSHEQWIAIEINGEVIARQMLYRGKQRICLYRNPSGAGLHRVRLIKEVQAMPGDQSAFLLIHALFADGTFSEGEKKSFKIEFIGDSINSGEGSYGAKEEQDWISSWFSSTHAYPYLTAKALNADYRIFSQSGYGVYCAWDGNIHNSLPQFYEQICGVLEGEKNELLMAKAPYPFASWQPDVIVINLGTNDANAFTQPPYVDASTGKEYRMENDETGKPKKEHMRLITDAVKDFLKIVRKNNPNARIFWVYGLMEKRVEDALYNGVTEYRNESGDEKVCFYLMQQMTEEQTGARSHPGVSAHRMAAEKLVWLIENAK